MNTEDGGCLDDATRIASGGELGELAIAGEEPRVLMEQSEQRLRVTAVLDNGSGAAPRPRWQVIGNNASGRVLSPFGNKITERN